MSDQLDAIQDEAIKLLRHQMPDPVRDGLERSIALARHRASAASSAQPAQNFLALANAAVEGRDFKEAETYFTRALEAEPTNHLAWLGKGVAS